MQVYNLRQHTQGVIVMAVSSIFHNVILDTPEKVEAFIRAAEASLADPYIRPEGPITVVNSDKEEIRRILDLNEKNRRKH